MKLAETLLSLHENSIPKRYTDNENAMQMIRDEIQSMLWEIKQSEKGQRQIIQVPNKEDGQGYLKTFNVSTKSTFPEYLQNIFNGAGTAKKFIEAVKRGKGPVWNRIALEAIYRLENGYKNYHGYDMPNKDFIDIVKNPIPF
jgi:hypothetical protein